MKNVSKKSAWLVIGVMFIVLSLLFFRYVLVWPTNSSRPIVAIHTAVGDYGIKVEIADTAEKRTRGLGGHAPLSDSEGMFFAFDTSEVRTFWMKDMAFPIDIVWLRGDSPDTLAVAGVAERVDPQIGAKDFELKLYTSPEPVRYVLEINAGLMENWGASEGAPVRLLKPTRAR